MDTEAPIYFWIDSKVVTHFKVMMEHAFDLGLCNVPCIDSRYAEDDIGRYGMFIPRKPTETFEGARDSEWVAEYADTLPAEFRLAVLLLGVE